MNFIDVHCHLSDPRVNADECIQSALFKGIKRFACGGFDSSDFLRQEVLKERYGDQIKTCIGYHPWAITHEKFETELKWINAKMPDADWLGETGFDFSDRFDSEHKILQRKSFEKHIFWANRTRKPLVLHIVRAYDEAIDLLDDALLTTPVCRGFVHSFSGNEQQAEWFVTNGYLLSFSGATFRDDRKKAQTVFSKLPADKILLESDTPDQALVVGQASHSSDLIAIANKAVKFRNDFESGIQLLNQVRMNAERSLWIR